MSLPRLPFVIHLSGFQRCIPATTLMSMVSDVPHPNPAQDRVGNTFLNVCKRQPRQPPEGLQAVLAHAIRHNTLQHDAQAAPSAWCLHLSIVLISHLPGVYVF